MNMKTRYSFKYFFREGIQSIAIHKFISFASISIIVACLLITGSVSLMAVNIDKEIKNLQSETGIAVFIDENTTREDAISLENDIKTIPNVAEVTFISKEDAFNNYKESLGDDASILDGLENDNPLRDGYNIKLTDLSFMDSVIDELNTIPEIKNIRDDQKTASSLLSIRKLFVFISLALILALGSVSIFIISNTIKLAMFARRDEIGIMKMVGATNFFIRIPFIIEGLALGVLAGLIGFFMQWGIYSWLSSTITQSVGVLEIIPFIHMYPYILVCFITSGIFIGVLGSGFTIRKFLDV